METLDTLCQQQAVCVEVLSLVYTLETAFMLKKRMCQSSLNLIKQEFCYNSPSNMMIIGKANKIKMKMIRRLL